MKVKIFSEVDDEELLKTIAEGLSQAYGVDVQITLGEIKEASHAYSSKRRQYDAGKITAKLRDMVRAGELVLAVTDRDLYVAGLNYVFGYAPGGVSVISLARLDQSFYGLPANRELFLERAVKEAVHEVGHLLGLGHCRHERCVMFFSNSIIDTDRKGIFPCSVCRGRMRTP